MNPDEKEKLMPLVNFWEEIGIEKGVEKGEQRGLRKAIALGLDLKFGADGLALMPQVEKIESLAVLQSIYDAIKPALSLDYIRNLVPVASNGQH